MAYPVKIFRKNNFSDDVNEGGDISAPKLDTELTELYEGLIQLNTFVRDHTTADGGLQKRAVTTRIPDSRGRF